MTEPDMYAALAAVVLAKCAAYDPYLTEPTEEQARAWGEQLARWELTDQQLLMDAVTEVYAANGSGYRPLPKDVTDAARKLRAERATAEPLAGLADRQARQDARFGDVAAIEVSPATAEARRRAIESFAQATGRPVNEADRHVTVDREPPHQRQSRLIAAAVARARAEAPPAPMGDEPEPDRAGTLHAASDTNAPTARGQCPPDSSDGSAAISDGAQ
ncbi:hypothetical protein [Mycolicibacterium fortuitum]|uniref:hypothetical protein n=1 Tax=Mycolicibacterium fortuitum TaxID=1766 RepID=UPI0007EBB9ED|nr:hypothetical protein [Mycolicibacterium fortuitum]OBF77045.1 hypothetical protein A5751_22970 [Mycolicibacterium fortuitum]